MKFGVGIIRALRSGVVVCVPVPEARVLHAVPAGVVRSTYNPCC